MATRTNICGNNTFVLRNPTSHQLFTAITRSPTSMTIIIMAIVLTALTVLVFLEGELYICRRIPGRRKVQLSFIMGIYPVFAVTSLLSILVPRAAIITKFTAQIYLSVSLVQFVLLINNYYGGKEKMLNILEGVEIPIASPPCLCCCVCCIPKPKVNKNNINKFVRRTRTAVLQVAIIKPLLWFIATVLWTNGSYRPGDFTLSSPYLWLQLLASISTMTALQGLIIFYKTSRKPLKDFKLRPKYFTIQMALVITNVQSFVITLLAARGKITCKGPLTPRLRAMYIESIVTIVEMFFFMILAMIWYRRLEGNVDKDQLYALMSKRYAKIRDVHAKESSTQLTLQDQTDTNSLTTSTSAEHIEMSHANGAIPGGVPGVPSDHTLDHFSVSLREPPNGMCFNEVVTELTDDQMTENGGAVQALWLYKGSENNGHIPNRSNGLNKFLPSSVTTRPKRWSDNNFRINWPALNELADRETDV